jgi:hypothetical protein
MAHLAAPFLGSRILRLNAISPEFVVISPAVTLVSEMSHIFLLLRDNSSVKFHILPRKHKSKLCPCHQTFSCFILERLKFIGLCKSSLKKVSLELNAYSALVSEKV